MRRDDTGALEVRVVNLSPEPSSVTLSVGERTLDGDVVDLTGAVVAPFDGTAPLRPWELLTLRVDGT